MGVDPVACHRDRHPPSSDRFIGMSSQPNLPAYTAADGDLNEAEVFWTVGDSPPVDRRQGAVDDSGKLGFRQPKSFGILAALQDGDRRRVLLPSNCSIVDRDDSKESKSSSTSFFVKSTVPKPPRRQTERELSQSKSLPGRRFQNSAPVSIPAFSKPAMAKNRSFAGFGNWSACEDGDDDYQMLPPHEIVATKVKSTSSVLEGIGRTLKGRDLRQVRNAVWRQTGFLD